MATSNIKIYKTVLTPERNALVDSLEYYLGTLTPIYQDDNFQYLKISTDLVIKINTPQSNLLKAGNYVRLLQDNFLYYFFITSTSWVSENCIALTLSIDSINTFRNTVNWSDKTTIIRQHKNRWGSFTTSGNTRTLYPAVDQTPEGIVNAPKYKIADTKFTDNRLDTNWYLIYRTKTDSTNTNQGLNVYLAADRQINFKAGDGSLTIAFSSLPSATANNTIMYVIDPNLNSGNPTITFNNTTFTITSDTSVQHYVYAFFRSGDTQITLYRYEIAADGTYTGNVLSYTASMFRINNTINCRYGPYHAMHANLVQESTNYYEQYLSTINSIQTFEANPAIYVNSAISSLDRTDSRLVKIIKLPYCPFTLTYSSNLPVLPSGWVCSNDYNYHFIQLQNYTTEFFNSAVGYYTMPEMVLTTTITKYDDKDPSFEPKLLNSDFFTYKIVYDSYAADIKLENTTSNNGAKLAIDYKPSNGLVSNLGFHWDLKDANYKDTADFDHYLIATRNNELPIFSNNYLDYIRNGYNYDRKAATTAESQTWWGTGISIVGAVASGIAAAFTGGGISAVAAVHLGATAIASLANSIHSTVSTEQSLEAKKAELKNQSAQVASANDIDLLTWYSDNRLHLMKYKVSGKVEELLFNLFYYYGYATDNAQSTPDFSSRLWFNYVQCNPVFDSYTIAAEPYLNDMKARYASGVTVYHLVNNEYDWEQQYENWETILF